MEYQEKPPPSKLRSGLMTNETYHMATFKLDYGEVKRHLTSGVIEVNSIHTQSYSEGGHIAQHFGFGQVPIIKCIICDLLDLM